MTWTAPDVHRTPVPRIGDERAALDAFLDKQRQTLLWKCAGLTAEQLTDSTVEPSSLSLLGLVRHMAEVERWWFRRAFAGEQLTPVYCTEASPDGDFDDATAAGAEADFATRGPSTARPSSSS